MAGQGLGRGGASEHAASHWYLQASKGRRVGAGAQGNFAGDRGPSAPRWSPECLHILVDPRLAAVPEVTTGISLTLSKSSLRP